MHNTIDLLTTQTLISKTSLFAEIINKAAVACLSLNFLVFLNKREERKHVDTDDDDSDHLYQEAEWFLSTLLSKMEVSSMERRTVTCTFSETY